MNGNHDEKSAGGSVRQAVDRLTHLLRLYDFFLSKRTMINGEEFKGCTDPIPFTTELRRRLLERIIEDLFRLPSDNERLATVWLHIVYSIPQWLEDGFEKIVRRYGESLPMESTMVLLNSFAKAKNEAALSMNRVRFFTRLARFLLLHLLQGVQSLGRLIDVGSVIHPIVSLSVGALSYLSTEAQSMGKLSREAETLEEMLDADARLKAIEGGVSVICDWKTGRLAIRIICKQNDISNHDWSVPDYQPSNDASNPCSKVVIYFEEVFVLPWRERTESKTTVLITASQDPGSQPYLVTELF